MAHEVSIARTGTRAKVRNPWGVLGLTVITFGVYHLFWWYFVNRELRDLGRAKNVSGLGDNPALSVLAAILGSFTLYIATVWTYVAGTKRAQRAQALALGTTSLSGWMMLVLSIVTLGIAFPVYFQMELNKVWETMDALPKAGDGARLAITTNADLERIRKLAQLRDAGALSDAEFQAEKSKVLPSGL